MKLMIVEDEKDIREILVSLLGDEGFEVIALEHCNSLLLELEKHKPDILLLDSMLPGKSGVDAIRDIRNSPGYFRLPVIMVTGLSGEEDKVQALDLGADDYVTKPFLPKELAARIKALARRAEIGEAMGQLTKGDLMIDYSAHRVTLLGVEVPLTLTEFKILSELAKSSGSVLTRERLRERALGNLNVTDRTIDVHMASLRKKLGEMGDRIETVRGVGYRFGI